MIRRDNMGKELDKFNESEVVEKQEVLQAAILNHYLSTLPDDEIEKILKQVNSELEEISKLDSEITSLIGDL
jgi:hypothetical protein